MKYNYKEAIGDKINSKFLNNTLKLINLRLLHVKFCFEKGKICFRKNHFNFKETIEH